MYTDLSEVSLFYNGAPVVKGSIDKVNLFIRTDLADRIDYPDAMRYTAKCLWNNGQERNVDLVVHKLDWFKINPVEYALVNAKLGEPDLDFSYMISSIAVQYNKKLDAVLSYHEENDKTIRNLYRRFMYKCLRVEKSRLTEEEQNDPRATSFSANCAFLKYLKRAEINTAEALLAAGFDIPHVQAVVKTDSLLHELDMSFGKILPSICKRVG